MKPVMKNITQKLSEEIIQLKEEIEEAKKNQDFEFAFILLDRMNILE
jgi:protein-arginine kinase activator protein McsA